MTVINISVCMHLWELSECFCVFILGWVCVIMCFLTQSVTVSSDYVTCVTWLWMYVRSAVLLLATPNFNSELFNSVWYMVWVSGFGRLLFIFPGKGNDTNNNQNVHDKYCPLYTEPGRQILILYGTEYGFSEEVAQLLFSR